MAKFKITGKKKLDGVVKVAGNKNSALKLIPAALLSSSPSEFSNVPKIKDVDVLGEIVEELGVELEGQGTSTLKINPAKLSSWEIDFSLARRIRASVVLAAPLLCRFGKVRLPKPGGDSIGERLLDTHFSVLSSFGAKIKEEPRSWLVQGGKLVPAEIFLEEASVTATEMALMLASCIPGKTTIKGAACEPHVVDLAAYLKACGARIEGEGTHVISIWGRKKLFGAKHKVRPDHIEVGTFAIASAITGGNILIKDVVREDLNPILLPLSHMGVKTEYQSGNLSVLPSKLVADRKTFKTRPWPGFPTDLMSPFIVLATQTKGTVLCHDWMYEWRIFFVDHLIAMGADITIADPHRVIVSGPKKLLGDVIPSADIRAGGALVLAALAAEGESLVEHAEVIDRGYEDFGGRLASLGARIERINSVSSSVRET